jgi:hypothetical protein
LGGTPWLLPSSQSVDHEIVVGISSSSFRSSRYSGATQERLVGLTTFFLGDGRYILASRSQEVPFERYFAELLSTVGSALREIAERYSWKTGDSVRLVFHIFKPIRNVEAQVVEQLIAGFPEFRIHFAFVTVSTSHSYLLFDPSQQGRGPERLGRFVPGRAANWVLSDGECLLQLKGHEDVVTSRHGFSQPVLMRIHPGSTFRDLHYIAQQAFHFAFLSWRGFQPASEPATLLYSSLVAKMLLRLRHIATWQPDALNTTLRSKKWFL